MGKKKKAIYIYNIHLLNNFFFFIFFCFVFKKYLYIIVGII